VPQDPKLSALADEFDHARGGEGEARAFQRLFEAAMLKWIASPTPGEGMEPWPAFRDRVSSAVRRLMAGEPSRRIAVFTSGGPIGLSVQLAIKGPGKSFLEVNWRIRNCSVTQFLFDRERFTLESFNCIGHLHDRSLRTYR
jgi:broad specificity phosphatase PhoE